MTTPTEFVLWLNGASGVMGPDGPNGEQWARIQEKLGEAIGKITADRLLERADEQIKVDQERLEKDLKVQAMREQAQNHMAAMMAQQMDALTMKHLALGAKASEYEEQLKAYTAQVRIDQLRPGGVVMVGNPNPPGTGWMPNLLRKKIG